MNAANGGKLHEYTYYGTDALVTFRIPGGVNFGKQSINELTKQRQIGLDKFWYLAPAASSGYPATPILVNILASSGKLTATGSATEVLSIITPVPVYLNTNNSYWLYEVKIGSDTVLIDPNAQEFSLSITDMESQPWSTTSSEYKFVVELSLLDVVD